MSFYGLRTKNLKYLDFLSDQNAVLLDVATGTCDLAIEAAKMYPKFRVHAVDISEKMLSKGKLKIEKQYLQSRIFASVEDAEALRNYLDNKKARIGENIKQLKKETLTDGVNIYPNPSKNELIIQLPSTNKATWDVELMDLNGKQLMASSKNSSTFRIDISKIPTGIFLVQFSSIKGVRIIKRVQVIK